MRNRIPIPKNPLFCDLIFLMGDKRMYASEFVGRFEERAIAFNFGSLHKKKTKTQASFREQLLVLYDKGYLNMLVEQKKGLKFDKNKKMFYVRWNKIVEDFIDTTINYLTKIEIPEEYVDGLKQNKRDLQIIN